MKKLKKLIQLMVLPAVAFFAGSCGDDDPVAFDDGYREAASQTEWKGNDVDMDDLDLLVDLAVKAEDIRLEFAKLMSNGWQGDLFSGTGDYSDPEPVMNVISALLANSDKYEAALAKLEQSGILTPTTVTRSPFSDIFTIFTTSRDAAKEEQDKVQEVLLKMGAYGNEDAQNDLYNYLPDNIKSRATDANDFFRKLNKGELNDCMFKISHQWRDIGKLEADGHQHPYVDNYAELADEDGIPYLKTAAKVSGKIAVSAGTIYFTAIDKVAGGYGAKIIEMGNLLENKVKMIKMSNKMLEGKANFQEINKFIVEQILGDIQEELGNLIGDDAKITKELAGYLAEDFADYIKEQCTVDGGEDTDLAAKAKEFGNSLLDIVTDAGSTTKAVIIRDEETGKVQIGVPDEEGRVTIPTGVGKKTVTVIDEDGNRITKQVEATEGGVLVDAKKEKKPYVNPNPSTLTFGPDADTEWISVLSNCKYLKINNSSNDSWVKLELISNYTGFHVKVTAEKNTAFEERSTSFVIEGYNDKDAVVAKSTVKVKQQPAESGISVTPESLAFDANGGTKTVTFNMGEYEYFSFGIENKYKDWISLKWGEEKYTVDVTVKPNATGMTREGAFMLSGHNVKEPTMAQRDILKVTVTQSASDEVEIKVNLGSIRLWAEIYGTAPTYKDGQPIKQIIDWKPTHDMMKATMKNNVLHIEASREKSTSTTKLNEWLTFDVIGYDPDDLSKAIVTNFQYTIRDDYKNEDTRSITDATLEATNIRLSGVEKDYFEWNGTEAKGMTVTDFTYYRKFTSSFEELNEENTFSFSSNPNNFINIKIYPHTFAY